MRIVYCLKRLIFTNKKRWQEIKTKKKQRKKREKIIINGIMHGTSETQSLQWVREKERKAERFGRKKKKEKRKKGEKKKEKEKRF